MTITSRIDQITRISAAHLGTDIPAPKSVKIELTANCNYNCSFCTRSINGSTGGNMDPALYSRLLREMRDAGVEELGVFYIGESFTFRGLPEAIKEAKDVGFPYVFLTTNGGAAHPGKVKACMQAGLDSLKFSLNYHSAAQLAEVARVNPGYWRRSIENLKQAHYIREEGGFACRLYASSIAFDGAQGEAMRSVVDEIMPYVDEHYWLPLFGMQGASAAAGMKPKPGNPGRLGAMRESLPCWSVFTEGHISVDGRLIACCFGDSADGALTMADLKEVSFMNGWNSAKFRALRAEHLKRDVTGTPCEQCVLT